jgi:prolyl oligopeptidase
MKKTALFFFLFFTAFAFSQNFSPAKKIPSFYSKHSMNIADDYAWMENTLSEETNKWVSTQNENTDKLFEAIGSSKNIAAKIKEYNDYSSGSLPDKKGRYFYKIYRKDNKTPGYLTYRKSINGNPIEIVNPMKLYNHKDVFINDYEPSKNSKYMAIKFNLNGSDKHEIRFYDITNSQNSNDILKNVKYSNMAWNEDAGIFYKKNSNNVTFAKDSTYQLFYHRMGTSQEKDELIFDTSKTEASFTFFTSKNRLFIIESDKSEIAKNYYSAPLNQFPLQLEKFLENESSDFKFLHYRNNRVYFSTPKYDWGEIRSMDINNKNDEKVVVPQIYNNLLADEYFLEDYIICKYKTLTKNYLIVYDKDGVFIKKIDLPNGTDCRFKFFDSETKDLYVTFFSRTIPNQNYKINLNTGEANPFFNDYLRPKETFFPLNYFETKAVYYKSRDGKDVPITIVYKKGITLDGNNPTLLEAYGGFGTVSQPFYETSILYFLEKGGVYAFAEIRGGGEKGRKWHTDGKGIKKMNSFNDFIDAAEFLIREKYTSPNKLAISGSSHGGLVVGAAMVKRPDLFKVAIPVAGKYDMVKSDLFTNGKYHLDEYGDPNIKAEFDAILDYSPYHNIKEGINYPTTLIIAGENDDRVTPFQSYKFAAKLQGREAQKNPVYIKVLKNSGHSGKSQTYNGHVESQAEFMSFLLYHLK